MDATTTVGSAQVDIGINLADWTLAIEEQIRRVDLIGDVHQAKQAMEVL
jgi:hypothetical protein